MADESEQMAGFNKEIEKLAGVVKEVANQTRILSLNAAIEAVNAGAAGRGFAIVAKQVRELAQGDYAAGERALLEYERALPLLVDNINRLNVELR